VMFSYAACRTACLAGPTAIVGFCGKTTPAAAAAGMSWFTPLCYGAQYGLRTPGGQAACQGLCNWLLP